MKYVIVVSFLALSACGNNNGYRGPRDGYSIGTNTMPSTASQCQNGGNVVQFYQDVNYSGVYAPNDPITSSIVVCNGLNGADGQNGSNASISLSEADAQSCPNGGIEVNTSSGNSSDSESVCNGAVGATGLQGPQGLTGPQGIAGVSAVQFCSNYTTSYPGTFPEFGLCANNNIYAVYWDGKNAWLAEVVPGYYASTSTSAPCDFTVAANCVISH